MYSIVLPEWSQHALPIWICQVNLVRNIKACEIISSTACEF